MPVTARLSKKLYDTLGEDVAQELVDWFNQVDATYRGDLKDLNELNFSRFDAKLEQRTVELVALTERRYSEIERRVGELDAKIDRQGVELRAEIQAVNDRLGKQLAGVRAELIKWMFVIVVGTGLGAVVAVSQMVG